MINKMRINAKKLVERIVARQIYSDSLTKEEKIKSMKEEIRFEISMYEKYHKADNNRWDLKRLRFNIATIISNIENLKRRQK